MDAVEYLKTLRRLCESQSGCAGCVLLDEDDSCFATVNRDGYVEKAVTAVEQWAKDHPVKTRQSEFLKMFPNAKFPNAKTDGGVIIFCPRGFLPKGEAEAYCEKHDECIECCKDYWLAEVTDNGNVY